MRIFSLLFVFLSGLGLASAASARDCRDLVKTECIDKGLSHEDCKAVLPTDCERPHHKHSAAFKALHDACGGDLLKECKTASKSHEEFHACVEASGSDDCKAALAALPPPPTAPNEAPAQ